MSKWAVLRNALLGRQNDADDKKASIHRHAGFEMLNKRISEWQPAPLVILVSAVDGYSSKHAQCAMYRSLVERKCQLGFQVDLCALGEAITVCVEVASELKRRKLVQETKIRSDIAEFKRGKPTKFVVSFIVSWALITM